MSTKNKIIQIYKSRPSKQTTKRSSNDNKNHKIIIISIIMKSIIVILTTTIIISSILLQQHMLVSATALPLAPNNQHQVLPTLPNINLYLNKQETRRLLGLDSTEIHYVQDGRVNNYALQFAIPIGYNQSDLHFTWSNLGPSNVSYAISLIISNIAVVDPPIINITRQGFIPRQEQVFRLSLPCSGRATAEVDIQILINITGIINETNGAMVEGSTATSAESTSEGSTVTAADYSSSSGANVADQNAVSGSEFYQSGLLSSASIMNLARMRPVSTTLAIKRKKICFVHPVPVTGPSIPPSITTSTSNSDGTKNVSVQNGGLSKSSSGDSGDTSNDTMNINSGASFNDASASFNKASHQRTGANNQQDQTNDKQVDQTKHANTITQQTSLLSQQQSTVGPDLATADMAAPQSGIQPQVVGITNQQQPQQTNQAMGAIGTEQVPEVQQQRSATTVGNTAASQTTTVGGMVPQPIGKGILPGAGRLPNGHRDYHISWVTAGPSQMSTTELDATHPWWRTSGALYNQQPTRGQHQWDMSTTVDLHTNRRQPPIRPITNQQQTVPWSYSQQLNKYDPSSPYMVTDNVQNMMDKTNGGMPEHPRPPNSAKPASSLNQNPVLMAMFIVIVLVAIIAGLIITLVRSRRLPLKFHTFAEILSLGGGSNHHHNHNKSRSLPSTGIIASKSSSTSSSSTSSTSALSSVSKKSLTKSFYHNNNNCGYYGSAYHHYQHPPTGDLLGANYTTSVCQPTANQQQHLNHHTLLHHQSLHYPAYNFNGPNTTTLVWNQGTGTNPDGFTLDGSYMPLAPPPPSTDSGSVYASIY